jgi:hypothetical protein
LAKTVWNSGSPQVILSSICLTDRNLLRQILAHELIHWYIYVVRGPDFAADHGETFNYFATVINDREGANYVAEFADLTNFDAGKGEQDAGNLESPQDHK